MSQRKLSRSPCQAFKIMLYILCDDIITIVDTKKWLDKPEAELDYYLTEVFAAYGDFHIY